MTAKTLTMKIVIRKMQSETFPKLKYSIGGTVSEQGHWFGFGSPLTQEEFTEENISRIIQRNCEPKTGGIIEKVTIIPKIIEDCRIKQLTLF